MNNLNLKQLKDSFSRLGLLMENFAAQNSLHDNDIQEYESLLLKVQQRNPWFTRENVLLSFAALSEALKEKNIDQWCKPYEEKLSQSKTPKWIGVINAGNIPLVAFHDFLSVLMSGNNYLGKNASDDPYLLPFIAEKLSLLEPKLKDRISFNERLAGFDAVIATGSNNSARYFDYYFGKYPHIIRMNRNGVAVLMGDESPEDFKNLGKDIFQYYGLGCRNVSKIYLPRHYPVKIFFEGIEEQNSVAQHHKYMNNFEYNNAIYLLKKINFLTNGFVILKEDPEIASPIAVLHYEFYDDIQSLEEKIQSEKNKIQCIVGKKYIPFGQAQHPQLWDYADGVDTLEFLLNL